MRNDAFAVARLFVEQPAAAEVQELTPVRLVAPQDPAHGRIDAVRADYRVRHDRLAPVEAQQNIVVAILQSDEIMVEPHHARPERRQHPFVRAPAQQPDKTAAIFALHLWRQTDVDATFALRVAEGDVTGRAQIVRVDPDQLEHLLRRRPQVEDIFGGANLRMTFVQLDVESLP